MSQTSFGIRVVAFLVTVCAVAEASPLDVRESYPAADMILDGRNAQYVVRFDGSVDHAASQLAITANGKIVETLVPPGTASLMCWPPPRLYWRRAATNFTGM